MGSVVAKALPVVAAGLIAVELFTDALGPAADGLKSFWNGLKSSFNRYNSSREKMIELEKQRIESDTKAIIEAPFNILKEAADKLYQTWDSNLRTINATQGYTKSDLQDLMASFAERIRSEGLSKYVSGADITDNLAKVLQTGLSGTVAEEFAYFATKLNAAVPTQDFFNYAETYASLAATAIKNGKSEAEAIAYANHQLELFASNVLYSSRQLAGGFTTGLKSASDLFKSSVEIVQSAKSGDVSTISGVLTSVAAITGSIAPDLASSMTDAIVKAATGGNSSEIVALRSLAGINAGNTEFLKALANNPQKVFSDLFTNLAKMQKMSNDNFMEVAEGLSSVFGLSMDSFARIDFDYLANAINSMSVNTASLAENMSLLKSGETTTTAEQLRMQKINEIMIEEGLSYVLDNEVARSIQENMWAEQRAQKLMEATYAVELKGSVLDLLEGIRHTIDTITTLLNPLSWMRKAADLVGTAVERSKQTEDIATLLELGKVGSGNAKSLYNLTTTGKQLDVVEHILTMMGGKSAYESASTSRQGWYDALNTFGRVLDPVSQLFSIATSNYSSIQGSSFTNTSSASKPSSQYSWKSLGKSMVASIFGSGKPSGGQIYTALSTAKASSAEDNNIAIIQANFDKMLATMGDFVEQNKSYEEWAATAKNFRIGNLSDATEQLGYSEIQLRSYFKEQEARQAAQAEYQRNQLEEGFWSKSEEFWAKNEEFWAKNEQFWAKNEEFWAKSESFWGKTEEFWGKNEGFWAKNEEFWSKSEEYQLKLIDLTTAGNKSLQQIFDNNKSFKQKFEDYFINHTFYSKSYDHSDVVRIQKNEQYKASDAITALANALTGAKDLTDPTLQTNAILSQILIVAQAILNQNNTTGKLSLSDTLSGMGLGLVKYESV
jgi:hypothetical protein